jgi:hypothetical protein
MKMEVDMPGGASGHHGQTCIGCDGPHIGGQLPPLATPQRVAEPRDGSGELDVFIVSRGRERAADATARPEFFARRPDGISALLAAFHSRYLDFERYLASPAINVTPTDVAMAQATGTPHRLAAKNIARANFIRYTIAMMNGFKVRLAQIQYVLGQGARQGGEGSAASGALVAKGLVDLDRAIAQWTDGLKACQEAASRHG